MFRLSLVLMTALAVATASPVDAAWYKPTTWKVWPHSQPAKTTPVSQKDRARVEKDVQRLESLLATVKDSKKISPKLLQSTANEADVIAARILSNVKSATSDKQPVKNAEQLRTHVQNMKKEALNGNADQSRKHAKNALKVATKLDEWAG